MPLILVPTPLGNLRDITLRALDVLRECDLVVAEDTRVARKLLSALGLPGKEIRAYNEHNAATTTPRILERARTDRVALTTDAGMPGISDPGSELVARAREAGITVEVLPGPSAAIGAAVLSGFPLRRILFQGFPPRASGARRDEFARASTSGVTTIWYESPRRIRAALADFERVAPEAQLFLLREYTKLHEQHLLGTPGQIATALADPVRGELVLVLKASESPKTSAPANGMIDETIDAMLAGGASVSAIAKSLAERGQGTRRDLYARASERKRLRGTSPKKR